MSSFIATCNRCGARYWHCFIGSTLVSGHNCKERSLADVMAGQGLQPVSAERFQEVFGDLPTDGEG